MCWPKTNPSFLRVLLMSISFLAGLRLSHVHTVLCKKHLYTICWCTAFSTPEREEAFAQYTPFFCSSQNGPRACVVHRFFDRCPLVSLHFREFSHLGSWICHSYHWFNLGRSGSRWISGETCHCRFYSLLVSSLQSTRPPPGKNSEEWWQRYVGYLRYFILAMPLFSSDHQILMNHLKRLKNTRFLLSPLFSRFVFPSLNRFNRWPSSPWS